MLPRGMQLKNALFMKWIFLLLTIVFSSAHSNAQLVTIEGNATDTTNGVSVIEIVINDTLSRIMENPKEGRPKYLKMYQNPKYVVRTDSTGKFRIRALPADTLYFKSYEHKTQAIPVAELLQRKKIDIVLKRKD